MDVGSGLRVIPVVHATGVAAVVGTEAMVTTGSGANGFLALVGLVLGPLLLAGAAVGGALRRRRRGVKP